LCLGSFKAQTASRYKTSKIVYQNLLFLTAKNKFLEGDRRLAIDAQDVLQFIKAMLDTNSIVIYPLDHLVWEVAAKWGPAS